MPANTLPTRRYRAAGGVVTHDGRVLLLRRPAQGEVRLPKGHVDPGEGDAEAARRETVEETGYADLQLLGDLGTQEVRFVHRGERIVRCERYYLMRLTSERRVSRPPVDARQFDVLWLPPDEAEARLTFSAERAALRRAMALLGQADG